MGLDLRCRSYTLRFQLIRQLEFYINHLPSAALKFSAEKRRSPLCPLWSPLQIYAWGKQWHIPGRKTWLWHHPLFQPYVSVVQEHNHTRVRCRKGGGYRGRACELQKECKECVSWTKSVFTANRNLPLKTWTRIIVCPSATTPYGIKLYSYMHSQRHTYTHIDMNYLLIPRLSQLLSAVHCKAVCNEETQTNN